MITREVENSHLLAGIWLSCSLDSHGFIDPAFWHGNLAAMRDTYLPMADNFVYRESTGGEILGFLSMRGNHIEALFVGPPHQGRGIGRLLLEFAMHRYQELTLKVYAKNTGAVKFYTRSGFTETKRGIDVQTGEEEIRMEYINK